MVRRERGALGKQRMRKKGGKERLSGRKKKKENERKNEKTEK